MKKKKQIRAKKPFSITGVASYRNSFSKCLSPIALSSLRKEKTTKATSPSTTAARPSLFEDIWNNSPSNTITNSGTSPLESAGMSLPASRNNDVSSFTASFATSKGLCQRTLDFTCVSNQLKEDVASKRKRRKKRKKKKKSF